MPDTLKRITDVEGWENNLLPLSDRIHTLTYERLAEFYARAESELRMQAIAARANDRSEEAELLEHAAYGAHLLTGDYRALKAL